MMGNSSSALFHQLCLGCNSLERGISDAEDPIKDVLNCPVRGRGARCHTNCQRAVLEPWTSLLRSTVVFISQM